MYRPAHTFLRICIGTLTLGLTLGACDKGDGKTDAASKPAADAKVAEAKTPAEKAPEAKAPVADAKAPVADAKAPVAPRTDTAVPPEPVPPPAETTPTPSAPPTGPVIKTMDGEATLDLAYEGIGELRINMPATDVATKLGKPAKKSKIEMEGASGNFVQTWEYPAEGLEIGMKADSRKGAQTVAYLKANASCKLPASWGLKIGSTRAELEKVYGSNFDPDLTDDETFIAGSVYWGVSYELEDGKVVSVFIGAAAE